MITKTIQLYENRQDVTLTTYIWDDSPDLLNGKKRPAILVCPGGAYLNCSDREGEPVALRFAAMGYHAFVLRYSTYFMGKPSSFPFPSNLDVNPNSVYPGPMRDIGKAFLVLRAHSDEWLLDTDRIAICGFSAGGHNCAMYSVYWHTPVISDYFREAPQLFRPAAVILAYSITDYHLMFGENLSPFAKQLSDLASIAYMGTTTPTSEFLDVISPALHVTKNTPPTFLWATASDELVPVENTTRMATALARARVPFEAHVFEEGTHGMSLADQASGTFSSWINSDVEKWIGLAEAWLKKRFALPIEAAPAWFMEQTAAKDNGN